MLEVGGGVGVLPVPRNVFILISVTVSLITHMNNSPLLHLKLFPSFSPHTPPCLTSSLHPSLPPSLHSSSSSFKSYEMKTSTIRNRIRTRTKARFINSSKSIAASNDDGPHTSSDIKRLTQQLTTQVHFLLSQDR